MKDYVYQYIDPTSNIPFYIGKGRGLRMYHHVNRARKNIKKSYPVIDKCKKLINEGKEPIIQIIAYFTTPGDAYQFESNLIKELGRKDLNTGPLLNLTDGGEGATGFQWSETRRKAWSGNQNPNFGKVPWKEAGQTNPMTGRIHSNESKKKMSEKVKESYTTELRKQRSIRSAGSNNPSYGKPARNRRPVTFRNIRFECIAHACKHFSVSKGTVYAEGVFD